VARSSKDALSEDGWSRLVRSLVSREKGGPSESPESAFSREYEGLRRRLVAFFRWKGCLIPEDYVDATFDRVARTLAEGKSIENSDPAKYVLGVARLVYLEGVKREIREEQAAREAALRQAPEEDSEADTALAECLATLAEEDRQRVLRYHGSDGGARIQERQTMATELGISLNTLRIRMHRLRQRLEDCVRGKIF
jgi:DNA-directed RNA polymerase specialized sigma24 family protein